MTMMVY